MKLFLKILNITTLAVLFIYIFLTYQFYSFLILITNNSIEKIYAYSKIPYYLLWITVVINLILNVIVYIKNKRVLTSRRIKLPIKSCLIIFIILMATIIFTPKFEFVHYKNEELTYPKSIRYDNLFTCNYFYATEDDYEGGYGDTKYFYIPGINKMIYLDQSGIDSYKVEYLKNNKVKIGGTIYDIKTRWYNK